MNNIIYRHKKYAILCSLIVIVLSFLIIYTWQFDAIAIKEFFPGRQLSNPVTALCFLFASLSFFSLINHKAWVQNIGKVLGFAVALVGLVKLGEFAFGYTSYIDRWLYTSKLLLYGNHGKPNYMAPNTAFNFLLLGISLSLFRYRIFSKNTLADYVALFCALLSFLSIIGYLYKTMEFYGVESSIPMAFPTAFSFLLISLAILFHRSDFGFFSVFTRQYNGSKMAGYLIPFAIIIPISTGALRLYGQQLGLFSLSFGVALYATVSILVFVFLIWRSSISLNKSEKSLSREIEDRKAAQAETKSNQLFLDKILDHIPDLAFIKEANDFSLVRVNKSFEDIIGVKREDILGKNLHDLFPDNVADYMLRTDKETLLSNDCMVYPEVKIPTKNGDQWFNIKKVIVTHPTNGTIYILGIGQEITEQKKLNDEIREFNKELEKKIEIRTNQLYKNEKLFRSMIENSVDIISIIDEYNRVTYISPVIEKVLGIHPDEILGKITDHLIHPEFTEQVNKLHLDIRKHPGMPRTATIKVIHKNGHSIWMEGTMINLLHDENVKGIVSNFHDVTERIEAEEQNRILEKALLQDQINLQKQLMQATVDGQEKEKKQIGMELHDNINQILASTKLYLEIGKNDSLLTHTMIQKGMNQITTAIREIRKLSSGLVPHGIEEGGILDGINDFINSIKMSTGIKFSVNIPSATINFLDIKQQTAVYRIIQEQLNNIVKHAEAKNVLISLELCNNIFKLQVSDDGKGFKFEKKRNGIGLSNIKARSELLNGEMNIETEEGKGCKLKIVFSRRTQKAA